MTKVTIAKEEPIEKGWHFIVEVSDQTGIRAYSVTLEQDYWRTLTSGAITPVELLKRSFDFLLAREPKESILQNI